MYVRQVGIGKTVSASFTRPNNADAYLAGDVVGTDPGTNLTFSNISDSEGKMINIYGARIRIDANAIPAGMAGFRLHLYSSAPTVIADNAAYNLPAGDRAKYLGYVTVATMLDLGDTVFVQEDNINFTVALTTASDNLYGILETIGAYTPSAVIVKTIYLNVSEL